MQLKDVIGKHKSNQQMIHFISIDVEGYEEDVIDSNDWEKYRPLYIMIEDHTAIVANFNKTKITQKMNLLGYELVSKLYYTLIFKDIKI